MSAVAGLDELDAYQRALIEALLEGGSPEDVKARLRADPRCAPMIDYVESIDLHALEPMIVLAQRWVLRGDVAW